MMKPATDEQRVAGTVRGDSGPGPEAAFQAGERNRLRAALGQFTTGVAVVTALNADRRPVGMTINSFSSVSLSPPLVSWCLDLDAAGHDAFAGAARFAVTVLAEEQSGLAVRFATRGADKFRGIGFRRGSPPVIPGGCAWFRCESCRSIVLGDHRMIIGRVIEYGSKSVRPLVFSGGRFRDLSPDAASAAA